MNLFPPYDMYLHWLAGALAVLVQLTPFVEYAPYLFPVFVLYSSHEKRPAPNATVRISTIAPGF